MFAPQQQETSSTKDLLQCSICFEGYNLTDHKPRIFPNCGHTIGEKCLQNLLKSSSHKCPNDKIPFNASLDTLDLSSFCVNYQIMGLIEESLRWERCSISNHKNEELKLICLDCKKKLCVYCVIYDHKDHSLKSLEDLKPQVADKIDMLERSLHKLDTCHAQMGSKLELARSQSFNQTRSMLLNLTTLMNAKTIELIHQLDSLYEYKKTKIDEKVGKECPLRSSIAEKILCYKSLTNNPDPLALIDQDISEYESKINESLSHATQENLSQGLEKLPLLVNKELESFLKILGEINFPIAEFSRSVENTDLNKEIPLSSLEVTTYFGIITRQEDNDRYVELKLDQRRRRPQVLTPQLLDDLKEIPELRITFESPEMMSEDDIHVLCFIISKMENIKELNIRAERAELVDGEFLKLLSHAFFNVQKCVAVNLCLKRSIISDQVLVYFARDCLPKIPELKCLGVNLQGARFSENALDPLIKHVESIKDDLKVLRFILHETKVSEKKMMSLFIQAPKLQELELFLNSTRITNQGLEKLVKETISHASGLKVLNVRLRKTKVADEGALKLFNSIPQTLEELRLNFDGTKISDASVGSLTLQILPNMKNLKRGEILTNDTRISDKADDKLYRALRDILRNNNQDNDDYDSDYSH